MTSPPLIGLNTDSFNDGGAVCGVRPRFFRAVQRAGGIPVLLPHLADAEAVRAAVARLDGFVMTGGDDLSPDRSGSLALPTVERMTPEREKTDFALLDALLESDKPTLCVCLGFQELNVRFGGALYQDLAFDAPPSLIRHYSKLGEPPQHEVEVEPKSRLAEALGLAGKLVVNSKHHQGVRGVGEGLRVVARSPDGLVEGLEIEGRPFFVGVQWHPEQMPESEPQARLFAALVESARGR